MKKLSITTFINNLENKSLKVTWNWQKQTSAQKSTSWLHRNTFHGQLCRNKYILQNSICPPYTIWSFITILSQTLTRWALFSPEREADTRTRWRWPKHLVAQLTAQEQWHSLDGVCGSLGGARKRLLAARAPLLRHRLPSALTRRPPPAQTHRTWEETCPASRPSATVISAVRVHVGGPSFSFSVAFPLFSVPDEGETRVLFTLCYQIRQSHCCPSGNANTRRPLPACHGHTLSVTHPGAGLHSGDVRTSAVVVCVAKTLEITV